MSKWLMQQALSIQRWMWFASHTSLPSCHRCFRCSTLDRAFNYDLGAWFLPQQSPLASASSHIQSWIWSATHTFRLWPTIIIHSLCSFISSGTIHYIHRSTHQNNMSTTIHIINDKCWSYKTKSCAPWFGWYCCQLIVYLLPSHNKCLRSGPSRP